MTEWMMLKEGNNKVRIGHIPKQETIHWIKIPTTLNIKAVECEGVGSCQYCKNGEKTYARFYLPVIDRADDKCKMLNIGPQIYQGIKNFAMDPNWGDPRDYDITIKRAPRGWQPLYHVIAHPNRYPLTEEEKRRIERLLGGTASRKPHKAASHDKCDSCGGIGEVRGMACICKQCNNIIWGC